MCPLKKFQSLVIKQMQSFGFLGVDGVLFPGDHCGAATVHQAV